MSLVKSYYFTISHMTDVLYLDHNSIKVHMSVSTSPALSVLVLLYFRERFEFLFKL